MSKKGLRNPCNNCVCGAIWMRAPHCSYFEDKPSVSTHMFDKVQAGCNCKEIATICNLNPPVVLNLSGKIASECQFFKQYWEVCFNLKTSHPLALTCLTN